MLDLTRSQAYRERAERCLTVSPFSKSPAFFGGDDPAAYPSFLWCASGAHVWDLDNNEYIDWVSGLGATILGYDVLNLSRRSNGLSLPSFLEVEVAERIAAFTTTPDAMIRFTKTGSEACAAAVRLARAVTGRDYVLSVGYHGSASEFVAATPPAWGVPDGYKATTVPVIHSLERIRAWLEMRPTAVAAVIIEEPIEPSPPGFYADLLKICHDAGALLIMDEVVTGFRWPANGSWQGSVAHQHGIEPDLVCYGKALSNGHALAALAGRREYMLWFRRHDPVFISTTNAGETTALAAADATLDALQDGAVRRHIQEIGDSLMGQLNAVAPDLFTVQGIGCRSLLTFPYGESWLCRSDDEAWAARSLWVQGMAQNGVILNRPTFPTAAHATEDVTLTVEAAQASADRVRREIAAGTLMECMKGRTAWRLFRNR